MKYLFKSRISTLLAILLVFTCVFSLSVPVFAEDDFEEDDFCSEDRVSVYMDGSQSRMLIGNSFYLNKEKDPFIEAEKEFPPNAVTHLRTISAKDVERLVIDAKYLGVVLAPSDTGSFEVDLIGVKDSSKVNVKSGVKKGVLTFSATSDASIRYICTEAEKRVNTVLLRVPPKKYTAVRITANTAIVNLPELGAPMTGKLSRGSLSVKDKLISSACDFTTDNGSILVQGDEKVTGKVKLESENGTVSVKGGQITGSLTLHAENGKVEVVADTLGAADVSTENGKSVLEVGTFTGDVSAKTENGKVEVVLLKKPTNLTLNISSSFSRLVSLPDGWKNNQKFGNGKPRLNLSCENGKVELEIGKSEKKATNDYS